MKSAAQSSPALPAAAAPPHPRGRRRAAARRDPRRALRAPGRSCRRSASWPRSSRSTAPRCARRSRCSRGSAWCSVRQGDGATVQPLIDASLDVLPPMIFHGGRIDAALLAEMAEVMTPLLLRDGAAGHRAPAAGAARGAAPRCAIVIADEARDREERFASARELLVLLSDMTGNRVWQMLARRTARASCARSRCARRARGCAAIRAASCRSSTRCLAALDAGRPDDAIARAAPLHHARRRHRTRRVPRRTRPRRDRERVATQRRHRDERVHRRRRRPRSPSSRRR